MPLTPPIVRFLAKSSDGRERVLAGGADAPTHWRLCHPMENRPASGRPAEPNVTVYPPLSWGGERADRQSDPI